MPRGAPRCLRQCHSPDTLAPSQRSRSPDARVARDIVLSLSLSLAGSIEDCLCCVAREVSPMKILLLFQLELMELGIFFLLKDRGA